jgi:hypothetical protein
MADENHDVYTVKPDGTDVRRLTTDGMSMTPSWTPDGRILYTRSAADNDDTAAGWFIMDADGSNAARVMSAAEIGVKPLELAWTRPVWQPRGGAAIVASPGAPRTPVAVGPPAPTPRPFAPEELAAGFSWTGVPAFGDGADEDVNATRLADGRVLVTTSCSKAAQLYDPRTGAFSPTGSATARRSEDTTTLLRDGRVLIAGGRECGGASASTSAELYDPATGTFSRTGSMRTPRQSHTATLLADGRVLITGGATGSTGAVGSIVLAAYRTAEVGGTVLATAEIYDPASGTFSRTRSMSEPRINHTATLLPDGRVLVAGGGGASGETRSADLYDPRTGTFRKTGSMHSVHWDHTSTLLADGRVLVTGGRSDDPSLRTAELYDPGSGRFSPTGDMGVARAGHAATRLLDGRVLIAGGVLIEEGGLVKPLSSTEMFDPDAGRFSPIGSMGYPRARATASLLDDGRVLIVGGNEYMHDARVGVPSAVPYQP